MDVQTIYNTINNPLPYHFKEYIDPHQYEDPKKQMIQRARQQKMKKFKQGKFKATTKHKPCFMDQFVKPIKDYPAPNRYKTKDFIKQKAKSTTSLRKIDVKASKRTYIDDIQKQHIKFKHPGVGKYNLIDPEEKPSKMKIVHDEKISHMDNVYTLSNQVPGSGSHNPHLEVKKLKMNRTDYKFFKEKHAEEQRKLKRSVSAGLSPFTYQPIAMDTFDSIASKKKQKQTSRWSHGIIDKRRGMRSLMKFPSPAEYNLINKWTKNPNEKSGPSQLAGNNVKLLNRYSKSARDFGIYH